MRDTPLMAAAPAWFQGLKNRARQELPLSPEDQSCSLLPEYCRVPGDTAKSTDRCAANRAKALFGGGGTVTMVRWPVDELVRENVCTRVATPSGQLWFSQCMGSFQWQGNSASGRCGIVYFGAQHICSLHLLLCSFLLPPPLIKTRACRARTTHQNKGGDYESTSRVCARKHPQARERPCEPALHFLGKG